MISVEEALRAAAGAARAAAGRDRCRSPTRLGRVLAEDVAARRPSRPSPVSAMDGYAVRAADVAAVPAALQLVGDAPAGGAYDRRAAARRERCASSPARRCRTAPTASSSRRIPSATATGSSCAKAPRAGRYVRAAGLDFARAARRLAAGRRADRARHRPGRGDEPAVALGASPAARRHPVDRRRDGDAGRPGRAATRSSARTAGARRPGRRLGRRAGRCSASRPTIPPTAAAHRRRRAGADLLVTTGGASVGEHDLVRSALRRDGLALDFWRSRCGRASR